MPRSAKPTPDARSLSDFLASNVLLQERVEALIDDAYKQAVDFIRRERAEVEAVAVTLQEGGC